MILSFLCFLLVAGLAFILYKVKKKRRSSVKEAATVVVVVLCVGVAIQYGLYVFSRKVYVYKSQKASLDLDTPRLSTFKTQKVSSESNRPPLSTYVNHSTLKVQNEYMKSITPSPGSCESTSISTAWVFDRPLTDDLLMNIKHLQNFETCTSVHVYCGTSQCVRAVTKLNNPNITSEFLVISNLVRDTPLEQWFVRHPLYKVFGRLEYEDHLQKVVQLGILWQYGGIYVDPRIRVTGENRVLTDPTICHNGWISGNSDFDITCFPKHHKFIEKLGEQFTSDYKQGLKGKKPSKFVFHINSVFETTFSQCKQDKACPDSVALQYVKQHQDESSFKRRHYGTLSYKMRVAKMNGGNLGDEIQACSGLQYLPFVDNLLERDEMYLLKETEPVTAFLNAWYGDPDADWPPPSNVQPIMTSVHAHKWIRSVWEKKPSVDYLKQHEPIGCRDTSTMEFMQQLNVEAYFSGCMTLMLKNPSITKRTNKIIINDLRKDSLELLPPEIRKTSTYLYHGMNGRDADTLSQFSKGYHLLEQYATAKLVITQRIHCALPCVAMGIPVIFIQSPGLPGGEGSKTESSPRTRGLTPMFHTVDLYKFSREKATEWLKEFNWNNPPPNPNAGMMMRMRATFWNVMRPDQALYDAAHKFGMVPLQPPPVQASEQGPDDQLLFHLVFTASTFKWHHWRTVESIFYHHPFAKVTIHSNTLQQSEFDVFTEAGYLIKVNNVSLHDMLKDSPAEEFISKLSSATSGPHWQSHQIDLLRLLVLYKWGGIYMDNDMIVVNPLDSLKNILTWENANNHSISGSFMALDRDNRFLRDSLVAFAKHYDGSKLTQTANGPDLLTSVWNQWKEKGQVVAMRSALFYMFSESDMMSECLLTSSSFDDRIKFLKEEAYAVRLNLNFLGEKETHSMKLSIGTICKYAFNSFCVLCNNQY